MTATARTVQREMGCTAAELQAWLGRVVATPELVLESGSARIALGAGMLRVSWGEEGRRCVGALSLPVLSVRFAFAGVAPEVEEEFWHRFDLFTRRGGG